MMSHAKIGCARAAVYAVAFTVAAPGASFAAPSSREREFQATWVVETSGGAILHDDAMGGTVRYGQSIVWKSRQMFHAAEASELVVHAKVTNPLHVNCVPISISVDGAHYVHCHANTFQSHGGRLYGDRNYNDGRGDVSTVTEIPASENWHAYRMSVADGRVRSWIDGHLVHDEPWPFSSAAWAWEIKLIGDHESQSTMSLRDVELREPVPTIVR